MADLDHEKPTAASRRPIQVRDSGWARRVAGWLTHRKIAPNTISAVSVAFALVGAGAFLCTSSVQAAPVKALLFAAAALCIQARLLCNLFDGMVAIEGGLATGTGGLFNELPDRIADPLFLISAGYVASAFGRTVELGWLAAVLALLTAYVRVLGVSLGTGEWFGGPMAKQHRMAVLTLGCLASAVEVGLGRLPWGMPAALGIICAGGLVTVARRIARIYRKLASPE